MNSWDNDLTRAAKVVRLSPAPERAPLLSVVVPGTQTRGPHPPFSIYPKKETPARGRVFFNRREDRVARQPDAMSRPRSADTKIFRSFSARYREDHGLLRRIRTHELTAAWASAADLDQRRLPYFYIVSDVRRLGIEASRGSLFEIGSFGLIAIAGIPSTGKDGDLA